MMLTASPLSWEHQNRHLWGGDDFFPQHDDEHVQHRDHWSG